MSQHTYIKRVEDLEVGDIALFNADERTVVSAMITQVDPDLNDPVHFTLSYLVEIHGEVRETTIPGTYSQPVQVVVS